MNDADNNSYWKPSAIKAFLKNLFLGIGTFGIYGIYKLISLIIHQIHSE